LLVKRGCVLLDLLFENEY